MKLTVPFGVPVMVAKNINHNVIVWTQKFAELTYYLEFEPRKYILTHLEKNEIAYVADKNIIQTRGFRLVKIICPSGLGFVSYGDIEEIEC